MARHHGQRGQVLATSTGTGTPAVVASTNKWSLNLATDKVDATAFGDANKVYLIGLKDVKGNISAFFDDAAETFFDAADSVDGCLLKLVPDSAITTPTPIFWTGPAWIDMSIDVDVNGAITTTGDFVARGSWTRTWGT